MNTTTLQIRIGKKEKEETRKVLDDLGMTLSSATKMFYNQIRKTKSLPIKGLTENGFTPEYEAELIKEAKWAKKYAKRYTSVDKMFKDILK